MTKGRRRKPQQRRRGGAAGDRAGDASSRRLLESNADTRESSFDATAGLGMPMPLPSQSPPAPDSVPRILSFLSSRSPEPFKPAPGGSPSTRPPAPCRPIRGSTLKATPLTVILTDWWLEKVEGEEAKIRVAGDTYTQQMNPHHMSKGASSSKQKRSVAGRQFRSSAIVKRLDCLTIEDESGRLIKIAGALNMKKTVDNGFDERVCECFQLEFPIAWEGLVDPVQWPSLVDPKFELDNEDAQSPGPSVADFMAYFESEEFSSVSHYADFLYGPATQSPGNLPDDNAGNIAAPKTFSRPGDLERLCQFAGLRMEDLHFPENPLAPPGEACNRGQESYQHESMQIDASEQEIANRSISSGYTAGAEEDVDIQQENMHNCSGEHGMVTLPIDSTSSQLGEPGIPKSGNDEVSTGPTLRSGKVLGMPMKKDKKEPKRRRR